MDQIVKAEQSANDVEKRVEVSRAAYKNMLSDGKVTVDEFFRAIILFAYLYISEGMIAHAKNVLLDIDPSYYKGNMTADMENDNTFRFHAESVAKALSPELIRPTQAIANA